MRARLAAVVACVLPAACSVAVQRGGDVALTVRRPTAATLTAPVFVVRHAERDTQPADDPVLAAAGVARAAALRLRLDDVALGGVVVSNRLRTLQTAEPTLRAQRIDTAVAAGRLVRVPLGTDGTEAHVQRVADSARALARRTRRPVLVVGHSNTVPGIVRALGGPDYGALCDHEYAWLFVLTPKGDTIEPTRLTYGAANPPGDPACAMRMRP